MKTRVPTIIIFILFILFNVGYGAFILNDGENFYDYELSNNTDYYVTIDYNDGHTPDYIYHLDSAEGIVYTNALESPKNEKNHTSNVPPRYNFSILCPSLSSLSVQS